MKEEAYKIFLRGEAAFFRERFRLLFKKNQSMFWRQFRLLFRIKISPVLEEIQTIVPGKINLVYGGDSGCCLG